MTKLLLIGYGRMGKMIEEVTAGRDDVKVVARIDPFLSLYEEASDVDAVIDFSTPEGINISSEAAVKYNAALIVGTTGFTDEHRAIIEETSKRVPVIHSANYSLGIAVLKQAVINAAKALGSDFDIEIVETHHSNKVDAPSGTALMLAQAANISGDKPYVYGREGKPGKRGQEIGIHALRGGSVAGEHKVMFFGADEIIELRHEALSRKIFATGAVKAAIKLAGKPAGMYQMSDVIE